MNKFEVLLQEIQQSYENSFQISITGCLIEPLLEFLSKDALKSVFLRSIKAVGRANPDQKAFFVFTLQKYLKNSVLMVGDGMNDIKAFSQADVSFSLNQKLLFSSSNFIAAISDCSSVLELINESAICSDNSYKILAFMFSYGTIV